MEKTNAAQALQNLSIQEIMQNAYHKHILIPAFNIAYLPMVAPIVETLRRLDTFALLEIARPDITKFEAKSFGAVKEAYDRTGERGLCRLHQDHVPVIDEDMNEVDWRSFIHEALSLRYDSVMIDGSRCDLEENIHITREVVEMAHARGASVEAELGSVLGHEAGPLPPYEELFASGKGFTSPEEAERFVNETGVDWLSVAVGNIHGAISGAAKDERKVEARLNIEHLRKISTLTRRPLVLHGGSGIRKEYVLEAIQNGITKINVGTEVRQAYEQGLRAGGEEKAAKALALRVEELITDYYKIKGSAKFLIGQ